MVSLQGMKGSSFNNPASFSILPLFSIISGLYPDFSFSLIYFSIFGLFSMIVFLLEFSRFLSLLFCACSAVYFPYMGEPFLLISLLMAEGLTPISLAIALLVLPCLSKNSIRCLCERDNCLYLRLIGIILVRQRWGGVCFFATPPSLFEKFFNQFVNFVALQNGRCVLYICKTENISRR